MSWPGESPWNRFCESREHPVQKNIIHKLKTANACKYLKTQLTRFLVRCITDEICTTSPIRFKLVPLQDFTSSSDIDWSKPISEIDQQLYKKYGLSQEEILYIEKTIKPMV